MQPNTRQPRQERGQAIVLIALMAVTLVAFVGLALDAAQVFENRRWMQNGSDAGALAGAYGIGSGDSDSAIATKIQSYASSNGAMTWKGVYLVDSASTSTQPEVGSGVANPGATYNCVRVTSYVTFPTYFAGVVGFSSLDTNAQATACSGFVVQQTGPGLRPMAVMTTSFDLNTEYCMFDGAPQSTPPECTGAGLSGQFGWVAMQVNDGLQEIKNNLATGFAGSYHYWTGADCVGGPVDSVILPIPSCLALRTGVGGGTTQELTTLMTNGTVLITPVWDYQVSIGGSESRIHLVAFAKFKITSVVMTGNPKYIKGKFVGFVEFDEICTPGSPGCTGGQFTKKAVQLFR